MIPCVLCGNRPTCGTYVAWTRGTVEVVFLFAEICTEKRSSLTQNRRDLVILVSQYERFYTYIGHVIVG